MIGDITSDPNAGPEQWKEDVQKTAYAFFIIACAAGFGGFLQSAMFVSAGERFSCRLRRICFASITRQEIGWFDTTETGIITARLSEDVALLKDAFGLNI